MKAFLLFFITFGIKKSNYLLKNFFMNKKLPYFRKKSQITNYELQIV
jgi:hypothetical protein